MSETSSGTSQDAAAPSPEVTRLALHLMAVRSAVRVGIMLNQTFPDEETLIAFLDDRETIEGLQAFVEAQDDIAALAIRSGDIDEEDLAKAVQQHQPRALEAIELLAERIGVNAADLSSFLLRA